MSETKISKEDILKLAEQIQKEDEAKTSVNNNKKKRMKTGKKALYLAMGMCFMMILFTMAMIYLERDSSTLSILATAGVGILPIMYGIYNHNSTKISLEHMEKNYIPNYDEKNGLY